MASSEPLEGKCGAQLRGRPGEYCTQQKLSGRNRCKLHGGRSPRGTASPHYEGKGYSRDLPTRLADRLEDLQRKEGSRAQLGDELELLTVRLQELVAALDGLDPFAAAEHLADLVVELTLALDKAEAEEIKEAARPLVDQLGELAATLRHDHLTWSRILETAEAKRRLTETQLKREQLDSTTMTAAQAMVLIGALKTAITEELDPAAAGRLMGRVQELLGRSARVRELPAAT